MLQQIFGDLFAYSKTSCNVSGANLSGKTFAEIFLSTALVSRGREGWWINRPELERKFHEQLLVVRSGCFTGCVLIV